METATVGGFRRNTQAGGAIGNPENLCLFVYNRFRGNSHGGEILNHVPLPLQTLINSWIRPGHLSRSSDTQSYSRDLYNWQFLIIKATFTNLLFTTKQVYLLFRIKISIFISYIGTDFIIMK